MSNITTPFQTRQLRSHGLLAQGLIVLAGTGILTLSSWISIPMWPIPATMQTLAVVMIGATMGWRLGGLTIMTWLCEAALGLPVLANGTGSLAAFIGPTGGYLFNFPLLGIAAGLLVKFGWNGQKPLRAFLGLGGLILLHLAIGSLWLSAFIGLPKAWTIGVAFIPAALLKAGLAAISLKLWSTVRPSSNQPS